MVVGGGDHIAHDSAGRGDGPRLKRLRFWIEGNDCILKSLPTMFLVFADNFLFPLRGTLLDLIKSDDRIPPKKHVASIPSSMPGPGLFCAHCPALLAFVFIQPFSLSESFFASK